MPAPRHTLDQLVVLDAIARTGSFAGASRELGRVPSAISYAVRALEEALEVSLFERQGRGVRLTADGQRLLEPARALLAQARGLEARAEELARGWEPELRVVMDGALPPGPMLQAIAALAVDGVPSRVRVHVAYQEGVLEVFEHTQADLMWMLDVEERAAHLRQHPVGELPMVRVSAPDHPVQHTRPCPDDLLAAHPNLVVMDSSSRFARVPREAHAGTDHVLRLGDFQLKRRALLEGLGHGWMPEHLVADDLAAGRLAVLHAESGHRWTYHPRLYERVDPPTGRACRRLRSLLLELIDDFE